MGVAYAEVIGDPVGHSLSPAIHRFWLEKLGLRGDYRSTRCTARELPRLLGQRCADPFWRGCSVTAPLKAPAAKLVVDPTRICTRLGAANAVFRSPLGCGVGANTDLIGVAEALGDAKPERACIIGAGGAARAASEVLRLRGAEVTILARNPSKIVGVRARSIDRASEALAGVDCLVNATPLGMAGAAEMPDSVLDALARTAENALILDMVYAPLETELLVRARAQGRKAVDGLAMLIGQAAPAFELFFGAAPPRGHDSELRERLTS